MLTEWMPTVKTNQVRFPTQRCPMAILERMMVLSARSMNVVVPVLLSLAIFYTLREAQVIIESWRVQYNCFRPHSSLGYQPPAPRALLEAALPTAAA